MKKKDIYNLIRTKAMNDIPDILPNINLENIEIIPTEEKPKKHLSFARILSFSLSFAVFAIVAVFGVNLLIGEPSTNYLPLSSDAELIGYQAVSSTILTQEYALEELSYEIIPLADTDDSDLLTSNLDTLDLYLGMFEYTLGDKDNVSFQYVDSDRAEYQYCIEFSGLDLMQNQTSLRFYYNASVSGETTSINGVITSNEEEITISGNMFSNENVVRSTFRASKDNLNYVEVQNRSTEQKQTFRYEIVENGISGQSADISIESVSKRYRATVQITEENGTLNLTVGKNKGNSKFDIVYQTTGNSEASGEIEVSIEYDETIGRYVYAYSVSQNGSVIIYHGKRSDTPASSTGPENGRNTAVPGSQNNSDIKSDFVGNFAV